MPSEEQMNPFVDRVFRHRTFFSRLHHFVRLSSAFVVFSGGIGTCLEAFLVWQLLQVRHMKSHPFILVGDMWPGLREWMKETMGRRGLVGPNDLDLVTMVDAADDAIPVILAAYEEFRKEKNSNDQRAAGTRRPARG
jgi:predicted Rossmann-fold nucleotide-binding protein